jgi:O-antigen/teichoic acid export membrane protein
LIVFSTSNLLISHILNPSFVTPYNVAFRYFSVATMLFSIIAAPLWSAITDAYSKNEVDWISMAVKRMLKVWGGSVIVVIIMFFMSKLAFKLWIGPTFQVSDSLLIFIGIYIIIGNWNQIFASFSNGTGFVMIQLITAIFSGIIFIPLAIFLGRIYGINGIVGAMSISLMPSAIWLPLQYKSVMKGTAKRIYLK